MLSIIIPVHNSAPTLRSLVESIPNRPDLEVIVVDDHSDTDERSACRAILADSPLANKKYVSNVGDRGAGVARNLGIELARGEWLVFADSDDWFTDEFDDAISRYMHSDYDHVMFMPKTASNDKNVCRTAIFEEVVRAGVVQEAGFVFVSPVSRFVSRHLVMKENIRFSSGMVSNDIMFATRAFFASQHPCLDGSVIYEVTLRQGSLVYHDHSIDELRERARVQVEQAQFLHDHLPSRLFKRVRPGNMTFIMLAFKASGLSGVYDIWTSYRSSHVAFVNRHVIWMRIRRQLRSMLRDPSRGGYRGRA